MTTEEIELNPALEGAGIDAIETDLGEYIVQLRREKPSHIITPAIHLSKEDIGQLFTDKFGIEYTSEPEKLTAEARERLRAIFLERGFRGHRSEFRDRRDRHAGAWSRTKATAACRARCPRRSSP